MFELRQHCSIIEYVSQFQDLLSQIELPIADLDKRFYFQNGLRHETSTKVYEESPTTFDETIQTASNFEFAHFYWQNSPAFPSKKCRKAKPWYCVNFDTAEEKQSLAV